MAEDESTAPPPHGTPDFDVRVYACPHCGGEVAVDPDELAGRRGPFVNCPHCRMEFAVTTDAAAEDDRTEQELRLRRERERELELSTMRIRQVATARRATMRARSYLLIGAIACSGIEVQAIIQIVRRIGTVGRWDFRTLAYAAWGSLMLAGAVFFFRRWLALGRELAKPMLEEPTSPPDFSTLGSDTERWRHLDDVQ